MTWVRNANDAIAPEDAVLFVVDDEIVATTRSRKQRTIERLLDNLAALYVGRTVRVIYPASYPQ